MVENLDFKSLLRPTKYTPDMSSLRQKCSCSYCGKTTNNYGWNFFFGKGVEDYLEKKYNLDFHELEKIRLIISSIFNNDKHIVNIKTKIIYDRLQRCCNACFEADVLVPLTYGVVADMVHLFNLILNFVESEM